MSTVKRISPMLAVGDMVQTIAFYRDVLGFQATMESAGYSIIARDGATIHLTKAADENVLQCVRGHTDIHIEVNDIAKLWEQVEALKDRYQMRGLIDQPYGMVEFHISDPNECLVFVGQPKKEHKP